jgi:GT2 family glycosyltransferase
MPTSTPELVSIDDLPEGAVVVLEARPGDGLRGCGGALALHVRRGDPVRLVVLAGGRGDEADGREAEVRAAARALGIEDVVWAGHGPDQLADEHGLVAQVGAWIAELTESNPEVLLYCPSPRAADLPTRVTAAVALGVARSVGVELLTYGLPGSPAPETVFDASLALPEKDKALERLGCERGAQVDAARAMDLGLEELDRVEALTPLSADELMWALDESFAWDRPRVTAVLSTWNKCADVLANLEGLCAQTCPFEAIVVVDNASSDDTAVSVRSAFPGVELIVMPHSAYGACETFNIGFASAGTELIAILDDDVVLPPTWVERALERLQAEPPTTAIVSTKIVEPGMPEAYMNAPAINSERYMSTFRGCASLARAEAIAACGYYDERLFIYGNERDLTCRLLNKGFRVLQFPGTHAFHKTPFGIQMGKRSLYYHARNAWLAQLKYAPLGDLLRLPFLIVGKVLLRSKAAEQSGEVTDATGTIGIGASIRATKGAWWVLFKAACSVVYNLPYCLERREPCRAPDYELPID